MVHLNAYHALRCRFSAGVLDEEYHAIRTLSVEGVTKEFLRSGRVLDNIDLAVKRGEMVCILGPSGSGKSTLLSMLAGPEQVERDGLWCMETPQVFQYPLLLDAYVEVTERNIQVTDEVTALQLIGHPTRLVHNHEPNPKITWPEDISRAEMLMELKHLRNDS